jgi:hypothetical protein
MRTLSDNGVDSGARWTGHRVLVSLLSESGLARRLECHYYLLYNTRHYQRRPNPASYTPSENAMDRDWLTFWSHEYNLRRHLQDANNLDGLERE